MLTDFTNIIFLDGTLYDSEISCSICICKFKVPHALARHNPGDRPTHNVRTAPTPTAEDPSFVQGISQASQAVPDSQSFTGQQATNQVQTSVGQTYKSPEVIETLCMI